MARRLARSDTSAPAVQRGTCAPVQPADASPPGNTKAAQGSSPVHIPDRMILSGGDAVGEPLMLLATELLTAASARDAQRDVLRLEYHVLMALRAGPPEWRPLKKRRQHGNAGQIAGAGRRSLPARGKGCRCNRSIDPPEPLFIQNQIIGIDLPVEPAAMGMLDGSIGDIGGRERDEAAAVPAIPGRECQARRRISVLCRSITTTLDRHFRKPTRSWVADVMLSFGRVEGPRRPQEFVVIIPKRGRIRLVDVLPLAGMRTEFESVTPVSISIFNVEVQTWEQAEAQAAS